MISFERDISLKNFNTFGLQAKADIFARIRSVEEAKAALQTHPHPLLILGGGSNILLTEDFHGTVLKNEIKGLEILEENAESILLRVGAGEIWHELVRYCVEHEYYGVENLSWIPGTVGAAPIQNIGAYGRELKDVFHSLRALRLEDAKSFEFSKDDCQFGYRDSIFKTSHKNQFFITEVTLKLSKIPTFHTEYYALQEALKKKPHQALSIQLISDTVTEIRQSKLPDPQKIGNAGSFFKNPEIHEALFKSLQEKFEKIPSFPSNNSIKIPAAWLIEQCGYKGKRLGEIGVHQDQALVLVNYGQGRGKDIATLAEEIAKSVENKFSIKLTPEVNIL